MALGVRQIWTWGLSYIISYSISFNETRLEIYVFMCLETQILCTLKLACNTVFLPDLIKSLYLLYWLPFKPQVVHPPCHSIVPNFHVSMHYFTENSIVHRYVLCCRTPYRRRRPVRSRPGAGLSPSSSGRWAHFSFCLDHIWFIIIPPPQNVGGAILDSLCRVGRSVGRSVRLQFLSAL